MGAGASSTDGEYKAFLHLKEEYIKNKSDNVDDADLLRNLKKEFESKLNAGDFNREAEEKDEDIDLGKIFIEAARSGDLDRMKQLVVQGADITAERRMSTGTNACGAAAQCGQLEVITWLVKQNVPFDKKDFGGSTPLLEACRCGHLHIVRFLAEAGANMEVTDANGWTLGHAAAVMGHIDMLQWVQEQGLDLTLRDHLNKTPLSWAEDNQHTECIEFLQNISPNRGK